MKDEKKGMQGNTFNNTIMFPVSTVDNDKMSLLLCDLLLASVVGRKYEEVTVPVVGIQILLLSSEVINADLFAS